MDVKQIVYTLESVIGAYEMGDLDMGRDLSWDHVIPGLKGALDLLTEHADPVGEVQSVGKTMSGLFINYLLSSVQIPNGTPLYTKFTVNNSNPVAEEALYNLLERYTGLVNSGDAGYWNCEEEDVVIEARKVLAQRTNTTVGAIES